MPVPEFVKCEKLFLKSHPELDERWVQNIIAENPSILGLGDLILKDKERRQPKAGRLDLLLQDPENNRRYEVEVQLGKSDESHIIRTVEYWDIERRRFPQYDHCAVIVAEDITSRFLNVISLFQGSIPLIAIQMNALRVRELFTLTFTTVLDELSLGLIDDDEVSEVADRSYWENRGTKSTVAMADSLLDLIKIFAPPLELKYNKFYIGIAENGQPNNFAIFRPKKNNIRCEIRLKSSEETNREIEEAGLEILSYDKRYGRYRIRLTNTEIEGNQELLRKLLQASYSEFGS